MYHRDAPRPLWTMIPVILISVLFLGIFISMSVDLGRDINSVQERAQVAADREDMLVYVTQLRQNMEERNMTHGHAGRFIKNPTNDLALQYEAVQRIEQRLQSIAGLERNTTTYQVAMDDIRGTIRELPKLATNYVWAHYGWWMIGIILPLLWIAQGIYFGWYVRIWD